MNLSHSQGKVGHRTEVHLIRAICNRKGTRKGAAIHDHIIDSNLDIIALTETWLTTDDHQ